MVDACLTSVEVVCPLEASVVDRILRRYASGMATAGSAMGRIGLGTARGFGARNAEATVAIHLARCPHVERLLWLHEALAVLERACDDLSCLRREIVDCLFEHRCDTWHIERSINHIDRRGGDSLRVERCYLACAFALAAQQDSAFGRWIFGASDESEP